MSLHEKLEPHLREVLVGKRLLLMKEMLADLQYPDDTLVDNIRQGFRLTGWLPKSHVFPASMKRPTHGVEAARNFAKGVNHSILRQVADPNDSELAAEVWQQTLDEADKGWVWFDDSDTIEDKILAKRFGLRQSEKVRMIDDCSIGGFNSTVAPARR